MKLLTKAILERFRALGSQDGKGFDAVVPCRFFDPQGSWTWYPTEYNPEHQEFFGYVHGVEDEWGPFSLTELEDVKGRLGLPMERELGFKEMTLREALKRDGLLVPA